MEPPAFETLPMSAKQQVDRYLMSLPVPEHPQPGVVARLVGRLEHPYSARGWLRLLH